MLLPGLPAEDLITAVEAVPATYAPECLSACELAFHCRARSRARGAVTSLGRSLRAELGGLTTVTDVLAAAHGESGDPADPAVAALRRAALLRAEALGGTAAEARPRAGESRTPVAPAPEADPAGAPAPGPSLSKDPVPATGTSEGREATACR